MSLLWRNHLRIGLCPDRLIVAGYRRGLRQQQVRKEILPTGSGTAVSKAMLEGIMQEVESQTGFRAGAICSREDQTLRGIPLVMKPEGDPAAAWCRHGRCNECFGPGDIALRRVGRAEDSMLSVPLAREGKLYGVMLLQMPQQSDLEEWKTKLLDSIGHHVGAALALAHPAGEGARWHAAVESLPAAMAESDPQKLEITVILSNHFVRYALLPWNAELKTEEEWQSLARHRLASVYGSTVENWALQQSRTAPEGARVVCAADRPMLEALAQKISACGATLVSVQPYLMSAFNRVRTRIGKESCWLVLEERGRLTLVLFCHGAWQAIRSRRVDPSWASQRGGRLLRLHLHEILEREQAILGLEEPCTQAFVYSESEIESWSAGAYRFVDLTLASGAAEAERPFAMALG